MKQKWKFFEPKLKFNQKRLKFNNFELKFNYKLKTKVRQFLFSFKIQKKLNRFFQKENFFQENFLEKFVVAASGLESALAAHSSDVDTAAHLYKLERYMADGLIAWQKAVAEDLDKAEAAYRDIVRLPAMT